jgi:hypothetical protein
MFSCTHPRPSPLLVAGTLAEIGAFQRWLNQEAAAAVIETQR